VSASHPITLHADPSRMFLGESDPNWSPSKNTAQPVASGWGSYYDYD
jgi:hypothetical protein